MPSELIYNISDKRIELRKFFKTIEFNVEDDFIFQYVNTYDKFFKIKKDKKDLYITDNYLYPRYYNDELNKLYIKKSLSN